MEESLKLEESINQSNMSEKEAYQYSPLALAYIGDSALDLLVKTYYVKRGRNATTHSKAKNATMGEYRKATGLEALFGYLYLKGDMVKLNSFVDRMIDMYENK